MRSTHSINLHFKLIGYYANNVDGFIRSRMTYVLRPISSLLFFRIDRPRELLPPFVVHVLMQIVAAIKVIYGREKNNKLLWMQQNVEPVASDNASGSNRSDICYKTFQLDLCRGRRSPLFRLAPLSHSLAVRYLFGGARELELQQRARLDVAALLS